MSHDAQAAGQSGAESQPVPEPEAPVQESPTPSQDSRTCPEEAQTQPPPGEAGTSQAQTQPEAAQGPGGICARKDPSHEAPSHAAAPQDDRPPDDETQRRRAAENLSAQLDINVGLASICERLAEIPKKGRVEAIYAAARLTQANAQLGRSIAQLLKVERRQTTIVHHIQPPAPALGHSNSNEDMQLVDALTSKMFQAMKIIADEELDPMLKREARRKEIDAFDNEESASAAESAA